MTTRSRRNGRSRLESQEEGSPYPGRLGGATAAGTWTPAGVRSPFDELRVSGAVVSPQYVAELMHSCTKRIMIGGGVRSGKSAFALSLARRLGARRAFVATAQEVDADLRERIARHQQARGADFATFEAPFELEATLRRLTDVDVVVIDCLTIWLANLLVRGLEEPTIAARVDALAALLVELPVHIVIVTNEVGMGVHPETALGRTFRDVVGRAHQRLARVADEIYFAALGVIIRLQPGPVALQPQEDRT